MTAAPRMGEQCCPLCGCVLTTRRAYPTACSVCCRERRDYNPRCDPAFSAQLLALFDAAGSRVVHPLLELGISPAFRQQLHDEIRILRRQVAKRDETIIGYRGSVGGYRLLRRFPYRRVSDGAGGYVSLGDVVKHSDKLPHCRTSEPSR